ncbi:MAG: four helix bundle protein [Thermincolia bacterium]
MSRVQSFEDLGVWQKAHALVLKIYEVSAGFPVDERFGLTGQLRRAAASIPTNIAEGHGRQYTKEYIQFLFIAKGSLNETKYLLRLTKDLRFLSNEDFIFMIKGYDEVSRMLRGLITSLTPKT